MLLRSGRYRFEVTELWSPFSLVSAVVQKASSSTTAAMFESDYEGRCALYLGECYYQSMLGVLVK